MVEGRLGNCPLPLDSLADSRSKSDQVYSNGCDILIPRQSNKHRESLSNYLPLLIPNRYRVRDLFSFVQEI